MHRLIKIRIIRDFERLEERLRRGSDSWWGFAEAGGSFRPAADFFETAQGLVLRLEVPGVKKEDLSLTLAGQELVIRGLRRPPGREGISRFLHLEMGFGSFERTFHIGIPLDPQGVRATCQDGVLEVLLPRQKPLTRRIRVKEVPEAD
jgi:HSP20 family protein